MKTTAPITVSSVLEARDYSQFRQSDRNRPSTDRPKLARSLKARGWCPSMPMSVKKNGVGYIILDGQNRFEQAKRLGIPVRYVVLSGKDAFEPSEMNEDHRRWKPADFVASHILRGNADYAQLRNFKETTGMEYRICASILSGQQAASGNVMDTLRSGGFKVRTLEFARKVAAMADACAQFAPWAKKANFVDALSKCAFVPEFIPQQFIDRVTATPGMLRNCATSDDFLPVIEEIYNHRSRARMPLAFMARDLAQKRNMQKSAA